MLNAAIEIAFMLIGTALALNLYRLLRGPDTIEGILKGKVFTFDITQTFMVGALAASAVPIMMIALSTALPARANRRTNLAAASLLIPWMAFNLVGGTWPVYHGLGFALELVLLACIIRWAWTWHVTPAIPSLKR